MAKRQRGEFFSIDRWAWKHVCDPGRMNDAVAYLILAQGTGPDNRFTSWSMTALQKYAGIGWENAKAAIDGLLQSGIIRRTETATKEKPRYELLTAKEIFSAKLNQSMAELSDYERVMVEEFRQGTRHRGADKKLLNAVLQRLAEAGAVVKLRPEGSCGGRYVFPEVPETRDAIWLPGSLVTGVKSPEDAPVRRLRVCQDIWTLRLFVDLYSTHLLADYGGIRPTLMWQEYERELLGEQSIYRVWGFRPGIRYAACSGPLEPHYRRPKTGKDHPVWESIVCLEKQGLLTFVPHLFEGDPAKTPAEVIHACSGEQVEREIALAAHRAALALLPEFKRAKAADGRYWIVPVEQGIPNVQMVGIARLRHRPHTAKTSAWYSHLNQVSRQWIERYSAIARSAENGNGINQDSTILSA